MKGKTINYDFYENPSQAVANNGAKYHIRINNNEVIDLKRIGEQLEKRTTGKMPDLMLVITGIRQIIKEELSQGNTVSIDGICRIEPILGVADGVCEGNERGNCVQLKTLRAHVVKSLIEEVKGSLKPCQHKKVNHSPKIALDDVCKWLAEYFTKESAVSRRQLEEQFGLSRYMAIKYLNQLMEAGKLYRPGRKNDSLYMPVDGAFEQEN